MTRIAAIMPTFNQIRYITEAMESVFPQVDRLIVVDDCSTDGTREYLEGIQSEDWDLLCLDENGGTANAINAGYALLEEEEWVTWVSSDNVTQEEWRILIDDALGEGDDIGVVYTGYIRCDARLRPIKYAWTKHNYDRLINDENCFYGPSFVIARDVWDAVGGHRGKISHDYDHWLRVEEECQKRDVLIVGVNQPGVMYRVHNERVTVTRREQYDAAHWQAEAKKRRGIQ